MTRAEYQRNRRRLFPEIYRERERRKYVKHRDAIRARQARRDRTADKERQRRRYAESPELRARMQKTRDEWRKNNPEKFKAQAVRLSKNRRARIKGATVVRSITKAQTEARLSQQGGLCFYCRLLMDKPTLDHFYPLSKGGLHVIENIVLACWDCNRRKRNKDPHQFIAETEARLCLCGS